MTVYTSSNVSRKILQQHLQLDKANNHWWRFQQTFPRKTLVPEGHGLSHQTNRNVETTKKKKERKCTDLTSDINRITRSQATATCNTDHNVRLHVDVMSTAQLCSTAWYSYGCADAVLCDVAMPSTEGGSSADEILVDAQADVAGWSWRSRADEPIIIMQDTANLLTWHTEVEDRNVDPAGTFALECLNIARAEWVSCRFKCKQMTDAWRERVWAKHSLKSSSLPRHKAHS